MGGTQPQNSPHLSPRVLAGSQFSYRLAQKKGLLLSINKLEKHFIRVKIRLNAHFMNYWTHLCCLFWIITYWWIYKKSRISLDSTKLTDITPYQHQHARLSRRFGSPLNHLTHRILVEVLHHLGVGAAAEVDGWFSREEGPRFLPQGIAANHSTEGSWGKNHNSKNHHGSFSVCFGVRSETELKWPVRPEVLLPTTVEIGC